jgi:serine/threonine protein kinase
MEGGALIGEGGYGCVFDKPLVCRDGRHFKGVGKVSIPSDAQTELMASLYLSKIPEATDYFVLATAGSACKPAAIGKQTDTAGVQKCEIIQKETMNGLIQYTMPYGGVSIKTHLQFRQKGFRLEEFAKHLLEGGALLALNGFIHYDIHMSNILIQKDTPRLIDFGMSFSAKSISHSVLEDRWKVFSPEFDFEPPEVTCITGTRKEMSFQETLLEILNKRRIIRQAEVVLGLPRKRQLREFIHFWNSSLAVKRQDAPAFFKLYWPSFDAWSLGVVILMMYMSIGYHNSSIKEVLRGLLLIDPRRRLDCVEALELLDPENRIVNSPAGKAWLKEKNTIRAEIDKTPI